MRTLILLLYLTVMVNFLDAVWNQCGAQTCNGTGTWSFSTTNNWANPGNAGCTPEGDDTGVVEVTQTGSSVIIVDEDGITYTGTISGTEMTFSGSYPFLGGTVTEVYNITLSSCRSGSGEMTWDWISGTLSCNGGADISITKICNYSILPTSRSFGLGGGTGSVSVSTSSGCPWTATSNVPWITITSGSSGSGNGTVNYSVSAYTNTSPRTGTMTIAGQTFTVTQKEVKDEVIIDFGAGTGIWVRYNNSTWVKLNSLSAEIITTCDMDGNGLDDVIIDFGPGFGIWIRMNNSTWVKLNSLSAEIITTGDMDGN